MRRSLSQIQESGGAGGGAGAGSGVAGGPGAASEGSVLRRLTFPRFFSMVACGQRATEPGRHHGPAAGPAPDPRLVFFSMVACRSQTPAHSRPLLAPGSYIVLTQTMLPTRNLSSDLRNLCTLSSFTTIHEIRFTNHNLSISKENVKSRASVYSVTHFLDFELKNIDGASDIDSNRAHTAFSIQYTDARTKRKDRAAPGL